MSKLPPEVMPGAARLRGKRSDTLSVLDNYGLPPERKLALSPRQCGKHRQLIDCACLPRFTFTADMFATDGHLARRNLVAPRGNLQVARITYYGSFGMIFPFSQYIGVPVHPAGNCQRQSLIRIIRPNITCIERSKDDCLLKGERNEPYVLSTLVPCGSLAPRA